MEAWRSPLVGRDAARAAIISALDAEPVRSLVLAGPAGVGRTRLAREALVLAERAGRPTRWAAGSKVAAPVPLGALAHLLPAVDVGMDTLALLQRATRAIIGDGVGPPPILGVDDVHLLDPLSVTLLHQLVADGAVPLVLTVRTGNAAPDPAANLWKDELATRIELQPLPRTDTERLVQSTVDGDVETRTVERLWRLSRGNPLYLRELVEDGRRTGLFRRSDELWRWVGPIAPSQRLAEIVLGHLGELDADEWRALEVLATADACSLDEVLELSSPNAVEALERRGLVVDEVAGGPGRIRIAHPLYAEVVRSRVSEAALGRIRRRLARQQAYSVPDDDDAVGRSVALLDSGTAAPDIRLLTLGAQGALARSHHPLAERLARAAVDGGGGFAAHAALTEAVRWQGHPAVVERLAVATASVACSDDERARLTAARALTLFCGSGQSAKARSVLAEVGGAVRDDEARAILAATEAMLAFLGGDPQWAVDQAAAVRSSPAGAAEPLAAAAAAASLAVTGRTREALAATEAGRLALECQPDPAERVFAHLALTQAEFLALYLSGRISTLERRAAELHRDNLATTPGWVGDDIACLYRGWAALAAGRPHEAIRWLVEALSGLEERDPTGLLGMCRSILAMARALVGEGGRARDVMNGRGADRGSAVTVFEPIRRLAEAWIAVAEGRTAQAGVLTLDAAALAAGQGQWAVEAVMLHSGLRLGHTRRIVTRLQELAARVDSPLVSDLASHASAAVAGSGERLSQVSFRFEEAGALLLAADTAAEAASAYERRGGRRPAAAARARAAALARACGLAESPALGLLAIPALTDREEEVARLASVGLSNRAIADRLVVSVRTVETHLSHAYTKLGINSRADLGGMLTATSPAPPQPSLTRSRIDQGRAARSPRREGFQAPLVPEARSGSRGLAGSASG